MTPQRVLGVLGSRDVESPQTEGSRSGRGGETTSVVAETWRQKPGSKLWILSLELTGRNPVPRWGQVRRYRSTLVPYLATVSSTVTGKSFATPCPARVPSVLDPSGGTSRRHEAWVHVFGIPRRNEFGGKSRGQVSVTEWKTEWKTVH